jgi:hypothetical protein
MTEFTNKQPISFQNQTKRAENVIFLDESNDDLILENVDYKKATFLRVGVKNGEIKNSKLTQCAFKDCYFRKAKFINIDFTGTIFTNCNFEKAKFQGCHFRYAKFYNCLINVDEITACLPNEPNLKVDLARNLRKNYQSIGDKVSADKMLPIEIGAHEDEQMGIFMSKTSYYRERYDFIDRIQAGKKVFLSKLSGYIWGYGFRLDRLVLSYITMIVIAAAAIYFGGATFANSSQPAGTLSLFESIYVSALSIANSGAFVYVPANLYAKALVFGGNLIGTIFLALLAAVLYAKISK